MADISTALVTALTSVATAGMDAIADIVPVAAPVLGAFMVVKIGIRIFHKVTGN